MKRYVGLLTVLCLATSASATEWQNLGARAMGMGGTGAALAQGPTGAYWNPAGLDQANNPSGVELPFSAHEAVTGDMMQGANDMSKIQQDCQALGANNGNCTQGNITAALNKLNEQDSGARGDVGGGVFVKVGKIAVFVDDLVLVGVKPLVDMSAAHTTPVGLTQNTSALVQHGLSALEFGAAYGHELPFLRGVMVGGALKGISGKVGYNQHQLLGSDSSKTGFLSDFNKNSKSSFQPGIDLGAIWDLSRSFSSVPFHPRLAIAAHDVNNPKFAEPDLAKQNGEPSRFSLQGNTRMGLAISPLGFMNFTADLDLTRNLTEVNGVVARYGGVGAEVNVLNRPWLDVPLRAGLSKNLADSGSKTMLSFGTGLHLFHVNLDLAVNWSPKRVTTQTLGQSTSIPAEASGAATLGVTF